MLLIEWLAGLMLCLGSFLVIRAVYAADAWRPAAGDEARAKGHEEPQYRRAA